MPSRALVPLAMLTCLATADLRAEPDVARQQELLHRLRHDCGSCHGMTMKGGLGPPLLPEVLAGRTNEELADVILHGRPGTPMPPWDFEISAGEAAWLVRQLKKGIDDRN